NSWPDRGAQFELSDTSGIRSCSHKQRVPQRPLECDGIRVVSVKTGIAPVLQVYRAANDALACAPGWKGILSVCTHPPCSARGCGNAGRLWQQMLLTTFRQ